MLLPAGSEGDSGTAGLLDWGCLPHSCLYSNLDHNGLCLDDVIVRSNDYLCAVVFTGRIQMANKEIPRAELHAGMRRDILRFSA